VNLHSLEDRSAAAGEYVLGTLDAADHAAFVQALAGDAGLRAEVAQWQDRLLSLSRHAAAVEPSASLWPRIEARLPSPARLAPAALPWWQRLGWWQGMTGLALAAAVLMGSALVWRMQAPPASERFVAVLANPQGGGNGWLVEVRTERGQGGTLRLVPVLDGQAVPAGRALQFWTKAPGAAGPSSLGLVPAGAVTELPLARLPALRPEQLFEITLEPAGGSPIGRPTGPVLFVGRAVKLSS
jgi:anti-sigma-K factor RskA